MIIEKYSDDFRLCADIECVSPYEKQTMHSPEYPAEYEVRGLYFEFDENVNGRKYTFTRLAPEELLEVWTDDKIIKAALEM
jgi:hypothetical protein